MRRGTEELLIAERDLARGEQRPRWPFRVEPLDWLI